ncbi:MAG: folylpolyglutamate synthase/dihydrofolate synthase family protein [Bacteroidales bacterium]|nr:folylpolyglutamate synthase/dihydrofolate synthase family protein [Bacteroidales bacterium]
MTYAETVQYLYKQTPLFQQKGAGAYKEGLANTLALDEHFGHPHRQYKTIHVAGTNGKGSVSHTLASILQEAGYRVGLYTSPHLVDMRERIRVNGEMIPKRRVIDFVKKERAFFEPLYPSFFEVLTALAFQYFAEQQVDVAVVEVGLGGRLDCTNIISPEFCVITNISFDHVALLGNTLAKIASEKAGIIKPHVPVVIGEHNAETHPVFEAKAEAVQAPIIFAEDTPESSPFEVELKGLCQQKNTNTLLHTLPLLKKSFPKVQEQHIRNGFAHVVENTHLMGRWQTLREHPTVVCDTGHNVGGFEYIVKQLKTRKNLRVVLGMVNDKDVSGVLSLLPKDATYYFCQATVARALPSIDMQRLAAEHQLQGHAYPTVAAAYRAALHDASPDDFIFVGGSTFVVADLLALKIR